MANYFTFQNLNCNWLRIIVNLSRNWQAIMNFLEGWQESQPPTIKQLERTPQASQTCLLKGIALVMSNALNDQNRGILDISLLLKASFSEYLHRFHCYKKIGQCHLDIYLHTEIDTDTPPVAKRYIPLSFLKGTPAAADFLFFGSSWGFLSLPNLC